MGEFVQLQSVGYFVIFSVFYVGNLLNLFFPMFSLIVVKWALTSLVGRFEAAIHNLIKNSQAVKKGAAPKKSHGEKRCEIQGGGQEMAVMVG